MGPPQAAHSSLGISLMQGLLMNSSMHMLYMSSMPSLLNLFSRAVTIFTASWKLSESTAGSLMMGYVHVLLQEDQLGLLFPSQVISRDTADRAVETSLTPPRALDTHLFSFQEVRLPFFSPALYEVDLGNILDKWLVYIHGDQVSQLFHPHQLRLDTGINIQYQIEIAVASDFNILGSMCRMESCLIEAD